MKENWSIGRELHDFELDREVESRLDSAGAYAPSAKLKNDALDALYDKIAPVYDRWLSGDEAADVCLEFYVNYLEGEDGLVLELGVGTGRIASELTLRGGTVVGLDRSMSMLRLWGTRSGVANPIGVRGPNAVCAEFERIPFSSGSFNVVIMPMRTIGHIVDLGKRLLVFKEVGRVLAPQGRFILDHYNFDRDWADAHDDKDRLMYAGPMGGTEEGALLIWDRYNFDFSKRLMQCTVRIEDVGSGGTIRSASKVCFPFKWFEMQELVDELHSAGLSVVSCWGDFNRTPFIAGADHIILVLSSN